MKIMYGYDINYDMLWEKRIPSLSSYLESLCIKYVKQICDNAEHPLRKILPETRVNSHNKRNQNNYVKPKVRTKRAM